MSEVLRVGIIGASARRGWSRESHLPALRALPGFVIGAVAGSDGPSAKAAAEAFGAPKGYGDAAELLRDPAIDVVAVTVKVPEHRALVLGAIAAGKHLYCEWPLGRDLAEAEEMAEAARAAGIHAAIGLQTRHNPALRRAAALIAGGAIGRVLSARVLSSTVAFGPAIEDAMAFAEDAAAGVTLPTIQGAHTIDAVAALLGPLAEAGALVSTQFPEITVGAAARRQARTTADHLLVQGRLGGASGTGAPVSIEVMGGRPAAEACFRLEVTGERGCLVLLGGARRGFQSGRLRLLLNGEEQVVEEEALAGLPAGLPDAALNVAGVYAALRDDIRGGARSVAGFGHAVRLTRFLRDVLGTAGSGGRVPAGDWPAGDWPGAA